jgi:acyl-CoA thioester hydrolase
MSERMTQEAARPVTAPEGSVREESHTPMETYRGVVYPWHCDHVGHMNVMHYVGKFDEATWFFFNRIGLTRTLLAAEGRGMAAVEQRIAYQREVRAGDALAVATTVVHVREKVLQFAHRMTVPDTGDTAAVMLQTTVCLDTARRRATALPAEVQARARALVAPFDPPWDARR